MRDHDMAVVTDEERDAELLTEAIHADPWLSRLVLVARPEHRLVVVRQHGRIYRQGVDLCASIMLGAVTYLLITSITDLNWFGLFLSAVGWPAGVLLLALTTRDPSRAACAGGTCRPSRGGWLKGRGMPRCPSTTARGAWPRRAASASRGRTVGGSCGWSMAGGRGCASSRGAMSTRSVLTWCRVRSWERAEGVAVRGVLALSCHP